MFVYNKIFNITSNSEDEQTWQNNNLQLFNIFIEKNSEFINHWPITLNSLHGQTFLDSFNEAWNKIKIFLRWSITIFLPLNSYSKAYQGVTLLQEILKLKKVFLLKYNEKLRISLLNELLKGILISDLPKQEMKKIAIFKSFERALDTISKLTTARTRLLK